MQEFPCNKKKETYKIDEIGFKVEDRKEERRKRESEKSNRGGVNLRVKESTITMELLIVIREVSPRYMSRQ